jgi:uncharacterized protein (TIGR03032 family)
MAENSTIKHAPAGTAVSPQAADRNGPVTFNLVTSRGFENWLSASKTCIAFSTYQLNRIFFIGLNDKNEIAATELDVGHCLGFAVSGADLWASAETGIYRFRDVLTDKASPAGQGREALYIPQLCYFTGDLDIHDIAITGNGGIVFANTRFNCLATLSATHSFRAIWKPPFISRLAGEDRCHLNGLALLDGKPKYVSCVSQSDTFDGWRDNRADGGVVVDMETNEIVCSNLSMPHSPRWRNGTLWLLNSGTGEFGRVDFTTRKFVPLCFLPGYVRGLTFLNDRLAIVGLSQPRDQHAFRGLPLDGELQRRKISPRSGFYVIDVTTGDILHYGLIEGHHVELYDVVTLPDVRAARAVPLSGDEQRQTISIE